MDKDKVKKTHARINLSKREAKTLITLYCVLFIVEFTINVLPLHTISSEDKLNEEFAKLKIQDLNALKETPTNISIPNKPYTAGKIANKNFLITKTGYQE